MSFESLDGAIVSFLNYGTGSALDLSKAGRDNGTSVIGYQFHGGENQQWRLHKVDKSSVWPKWVIENTYSTNNHQLWYLVTADTAGRVFRIQNVGTGTYVDLLNGSSDNGTKISGWSGSVEAKNPHQLWRVLRY
ncbi:carbohydrate-binding module family 13 protein [Rostrohypoxylon terebratum]|nr:carbohydrate-binding module family 13 protein [Rostrohypoxylon terebratum]